MGHSTGFNPYFHMVACTPAATIFPATRGVFATVAGTITGACASGATVTGLPVAVGHNPIQMISITAATATGLFLGY